MREANTALLDTLESFRVIRPNLREVLPDLAIQGICQQTWTSPLQILLFFSSYIAHILNAEDSLLIYSLL